MSSLFNAQSFVNGASGPFNQRFPMPRPPSLPLAAQQGAGVSNFAGHREAQPHHPNNGQQLPQQPVFSFGGSSAAFSPPVNFEHRQRFAPYHATTSNRGNTAQEGYPASVSTSSVTGNQGGPSHPHMAQASYSNQDGYGSVESPLVARMRHLRNTLQREGSLGHPYSGPRRGRSRSSRTATSSASSPKMWKIKIIFLGDTQETKRPDSTRLENLTQAGLGECPLRVDSTGTMHDILEAVKLVFEEHVVPKLSAEEVVALQDICFDLSYVRGSGVWGLLPIRETLTVADLSIIDPHTLYARPSVTILPLPDKSSSSHEVRATKVNARRPETHEMETTTEVMYDGLFFNFDEIFDIPGLIAAGRRVCSGIQVITVPQPSEVTAAELLRFNSEINAVMKPRLEIEGENAYDAGGITRGYIWALQEALRTTPVDNKYPHLFVLEGSQNSCTISSHPRIYDMKIPEFLAKFIIFSLLNVDVAFVGLSRFTVQYMCSTDLTTLPSMIPDDIPDALAKHCYMKLQQLNTGAELSPAELEDVKATLKTYGWDQPITAENIEEASAFLMYETVVCLRRPALDMLRKAFLEHPVGKWVAEHPLLLDSLCPPYLEVDVDTFMESFLVTADNITGIQLLREFVEDYVAGGGRVSHLLVLITGYPTLGRYPLTLTVDPTEQYFNVSTCDSRITVNSELSFDDFKENMNILLQNGMYGFTRA